MKIWPSCTFISSRIPVLFSGILTLAMISACDQGPGHTDTLPPVSDTNAGTFVVLEESLQQLKDDFNVNRGRIRLLFIVGDTCGICLRGMADLNDVFISSAQNDDRLVTFVVHVPTLGAKQEDVLPAMQLLHGPRIHHYWDGVGKSGVHLGQTLETNGIYAWDVWMAYWADAEWMENVPPGPEFWMHQLGPLPRVLQLDADRFADRTLALMDTIETESLEAPREDNRKRVADGAVIPKVSQPRGVAIGTHLRGVGGYRNLNGIKSITQSGSINWKTGSTTIEVSQDQLGGLNRRYGDDETPLPGHVEKTLSDSWEINGPLFQWKDRGHQVRIDGMLKVGTSLSWKLYVFQKNGQRRVLFIDSHSGDIVLTKYLDTEGRLLFSIHAQDFREVNGFRFPFEIEYLDTAGNTIAKETYGDIKVTKKDVPELHSDALR